MYGNVCKCCSEWNRQGLPQLAANFQQPPSEVSHCVAQSPFWSHEMCNINNNNNDNNNNNNNNTAAESSWSDKETIYYTNA
jgi:hypothetical protein